MARPIQPKIDRYTEDPKLHENELPSADGLQTLALESNDDMTKTNHGVQPVGSSNTMFKAPGQNHEGDVFLPFSMAQVPLLPSQLLNSYDSAQLSSQLFAEQKPVADGYSPNRAVPILPSQHEILSPTQDPSFVEVANDMINKSLDRKPCGTSVVEPDSVLDESGRLYHGYKEGKYFLPNDAAEQDRLDLQHTIFRLLFDGWLALAPFTSPPAFVLDIGTGTGIWAQEFAEQNPSSYVIGTDLSAIQPVSSLRNCVFVKDDAEEPWCYPHPFPDHSDCHGPCEHWVKFDYVHLRMMLTCFDDTRTVIRRAFDNLNPGGWLEFQDTTLEFHQANPNFTGNAFMRWAEGCNQGLTAVGRDPLKAWKYKEWLEEAGFVDVTHRQFWGPLGTWASGDKFKQIGAYGQSNMYDGVRGIGWKLLKAAGRSSEDIERLINEVRYELRRKDNHIHGICHVVYGRKPFPGEIKS